MQKNTLDLEEIMDERGFIDYWNFAPQADILVVQTIKTKVKMETESGIILSTQENKETVCPDMGIVVSQGPYQDKLSLYFLEYLR